MIVGSYGPYVSERSPCLSRCCSLILCSCYYHRDHVIGKLYISVQQNNHAAAYFIRPSTASVLYMQIDYINLSSCVTLTDAHCHTEL